MDIWLVGFQYSSKFKLTTFIPDPKCMSEIRPLFLAGLSASPESHAGNPNIRALRKSEDHCPQPSLATGLCENHATDVSNVMP